jgi:hypothetical protein
VGFREDVPLEDFIDLTPYAREVFLSGTRTGGTSSSFMIGPPVKPPEEHYLTPIVAGGVVRTFTTCRELVSWPSVVWDVNGYYHSLEVGFRATRRQLLAAYIRLNGQDSDYLTYVFKQLLTPDVRRRYDAAPLGTLFYDRYVEEQIRRRAQEMAKEWKLQPEDVLRNWGFKTEEEVEEDQAAPAEQDGGEPDAESDEEVDIPQESGEDGITSPARPEEPWPYAYFLWRLRNGDHHPGSIIPDGMRQWQQAIAAECHRRGEVVRFAVGMMGSRVGSRVATMSVAEATVVFIAADRLDEIDQLAPEAVNRLILRD